MADKTSPACGGDETLPANVNTCGARTRTVTGVKDGGNQGTSPPADASSEGRRKTRGDKFDASQLPTPPPDPIQEGNIFEEAFKKHKAYLEAEALRKEGEFFDYLMGLPTPTESHLPTLARSPSDFAASLGAEDAFDHLNRLYVLMEQVLTLREQNSKLSRRVRELEHLRALRSAHREVEQAVLTGEDPVLPEEDTGFAESLLGAMLSTGCDESHRRNLRPPVPRQRSRSVGLEPFSLLHEISRPPNRPMSSKRRESAINGAPKVSKWTKVKAAFKWERAYTSGTGESEVTRYLKVPENTTTEASTAIGSSPRAVETSAPPTPATLSPSTSTEDMSHGGVKSVSSYNSCQLSPQVKQDGREDESNRSLDGDVSVGHSPIFPAQTSKDETSDGKVEKWHKTPWGKVKDMIQLRRESLRRRPERGSIRSEDGYSISSLESSEILQEIETARPRITSDSPTPSLKPSSAGNESVDLASRRLTPTLTITVPSNEELRIISTPESVSPPLTMPLNSVEDRLADREFEASTTTQDCTNLPPIYRQFDAARSNTCQDISFSGEFQRQCSVRRDPPLGSSSKMQQHDSKWHKVKNAFLTNTTSVPTSPSRLVSFFNDIDGLESYNASAEELDRDTTTLNIQAEIQRNYQILHDKLSGEFYRKLAEWEKLKTPSQLGGQQSTTHDIGIHSSPTPKERDSINTQLLGEGQLTPEFRKKLQEWKRMKKVHHSPTSNEHQAGRRRITDWQLWRSPSKPETKSESEHTKPHLSEDFIKKMEQWKKIKSGHCDDDGDDQESNANKASGAVVGQRDSFYNSGVKQGKSWKAQEEKEFQWLEKELNKIEREQQKYEKQREKFLDREARLSKLRRVVGSSPQKKEVLIHTSTGLFRFEGISRKFTRKLYEWEKSQGISPESSTFRLLNPAYRFPTGHPPVNTSHERGPRHALKRSKSVGSMAEGSTNSETPIRQPSSLSLNDMEELEAECLAAETQICAEPGDAGIAVALDDYEPEAIIVDIEDVVEETASPMAELQPHQTPIYCVAGSETTSIAVPLGTVTASHEPSPIILVEAGESHPMASRSAAVEKIAARDQNLLSGHFVSQDEKELAEKPEGKSMCELPRKFERTTRSSQSSIEQCSEDGYLTVLNKMQTNEKTLSRLEARISEIKEELQGDFSMEEEAAELLNNLQEYDRSGSGRNSRRDIIIKEETSLKESLESCWLQQVDLSRLLLKRMPQPQGIQPDGRVRLLELVGKLHSIVTSRYNDVLRNRQDLQEAQASAVDNAEISSYTEGDEQIGNSVPHGQSADELLSMILDATPIIFEPTIDRHTFDFTRDESLMEKRSDTLKTREKRVPPGEDVELMKEMKDGCRKDDYPMEQFSGNTMVDEIPCSTERITAAKRRTKSRRKDSADNEEIVITVDKDNKRKKVLKTRRLTDTQVGYECRSQGSEESSKLAGDTDTISDEPTVKTVVLTTSVFNDSPNIERIVINENTLEKIVVRTANNEPMQSSKLEPSSAHSSNRSSGNFSDAQDFPGKKEKNGSRNVFVKTTRMIFSPFRRDGKGKASGPNPGEIESLSDRRNPGDTHDASNCEIKSDTVVGQPLWALRESRSNPGSPAQQRKQRGLPEYRGEIARRPPLPQSPILSRKEYHRASPKETAPSIRMMIHRYNQKLEDAGSPASSGSGSPIWRSPASERRVRTQMERYQEEVRRAITGPLKLEVQRSVSAGVIRDDSAKSPPSNSAIDSPLEVRGILKSSSVDSIKNTTISNTADAKTGSNDLRTPEDSATERTLTVKKMMTDNRLSPSLVHKLSALSTAAARRETQSILSSSSEASPAAPDGAQSDRDGPPLTGLRAMKIRRAKEDFLSRGPGCYSHDPQRDRTGDDSAARATEYRNRPMRLDLMKSASVGMINVDPDTFERLALDRGCESLPRSSKRCSESTGRFSNIASKFRRARMRRGKDKDGKMSTVSMLCRQSLLVDIQGDETTKSCPSTPAPQREDDDSPWIKNPMKTFN